MNEKTIKQEINVNNQKILLWGPKSNKVIIAVHGSGSNKEDTVICLLANIAIVKGYQVISFDLPEHGARKNDKSILCKVQNCVPELINVMSYAKKNYEKISIFGCSMGAYFSLLAFKDDIINQCLFLSPIVNMFELIKQMMMWANVNEDILKEKKVIPTNFGQTLYFDYYNYVKSHPINSWNKNTFILYGNNDDLQSLQQINNFVKLSNAKLDVLENGEHYFHTEKQLECYKKWLQDNIE